MNQKLFNETNKEIEKLQAAIDSGVLRYREKRILEKKIQGLRNELVAVVNAQNGVVV